MHVLRTQLLASAVNISFHVLSYNATLPHNNGSSCKCDRIQKRVSPLDKIHTRTQSILFSLAFLFSTASHSMYRCLLLMQPGWTQHFSSVVGLVVMGTVWLCTRFLLSCRASFVVPSSPQPVTPFFSAQFFLRPLLVEEVVEAPKYEEKPEVNDPKAFDRRLCRPLVVVVVLSTDCSTVILLRSNYVFAHSTTPVRVESHAQASSHPCSSKPTKLSAADACRLRDCTFFHVSSSKQTNPCPAFVTGSPWKESPLPALPGRFVRQSTGYGTYCSLLWKISTRM